MFVNSLVYERIMKCVYEPFLTRSNAFCSLIMMKIEVYKVCVHNMKLSMKCLRIPLFMKGLCKCEGSLSKCVLLIFSCFSKEIKVINIKILDVATVYFLLFGLDQTPMIPPPSNGSLFTFFFRLF